jgi:hypothetical protein
VSNLGIIEVVIPSVLVALSYTANQLLGQGASSSFV